MKKYKPYFDPESGITFADFQQVRQFIWETRDHVSEISGEPLYHQGHPQWTWQFMHILNRHHTHYVLNPNNILLGTVFEHEHQEQYEIFRERQDELRREYYSKYY